MYFRTTEKWPIFLDLTGIFCKESLHLDVCIGCLHTCHMSMCYTSNWYHLKLRFTLHSQLLAPLLFTEGRRWLLCVEQRDYVNWVLTAFRGVLLVNNYCSHVFSDSDFMVTWKTVAVVCSAPLQAVQVSHGLPASSPTESIATTLP
jgi:hypothetical protein